MSRQPAKALAVLILIGLPLSGMADNPAKKKTNRPAPAAPKPVAPPAPRSALLTVADWQKAPLTPLTPGEIDGLVAHEQQADKIQPAPLTSDELFLRRVTLDLTGRLPLPADVSEFSANTDPRKRAKVIDRLLDSEDFARHWAHFWRDVVTARVTDRRSAFLARGFEDWLFEQFQGKPRWDRIVREILTAGGELRFDEPGKNGAAYFLGNHRGAEAANEQAAETARIFLGIQLQCAQCHDHPFDQWKRVQFHELAGYFARVSQRPIRDGGKLAGFQLVSRAQGEHEMPGKEDPKKTLVTNPRFLDGNGPRPGASDQDRRKSLAEAVTSKDNYWFAAAFVNRLWGELMGQAFYEPVDDMGPKKEAVFPTVLTRLTASFRASDYDVKRLFRDVLNSKTYQRQIRLSESNEQHLHFAAAYPTRLRADALWQSLVGVLGNLGGPAEPERPRGGLQGLEGQFKTEFDFDPSLKPDEVEGSISQALLMMNNPAIQQRVRAQGANLLARILKSYADDGSALRILYLRTLARKPTDREMARCREYLDQVGDRGAAFEDILWSLLNSTEFQTKR